MIFILDTNTVSYYLRGIEAVVKRVQERNPEDLAISSVTAMELRYGAARRRSPRLTAAVDAVLRAVRILPFDLAAAERSGTLRATLEAKGVGLSLADTQIAGHALVVRATLVTNDAAFRRVTGLRIADWSRPATRAARPRKRSS